MSLYPSTLLAYLSDSYCFESAATLIGIEKTETGADMLILDQTIFYPQGGGQPYDQGIIASSSGTFEVKEVRFKEGIVYHMGSFSSGSFNAEDKVELKVNEERRKLNCRIHTGGHLVDVAVQRSGLKLIPGKGYHFPDSPYVEYIGVMEPDRREIIQQELQKHLDYIVAEKKEITSLVVGLDELKNYCDYVPDYVPRDKPSRVVLIGGRHGCPCGGTHIKNLSELAAVKIKKLQVKGGNTRVSYSVE